MSLKRGPRGPYKEYEYRGSTAPIPRSTKSNRLLRPLRKKRIDFATEGEEGNHQSKRLRPKYQQFKQAQPTAVPLPSEAHPHTASFVETTEHQEHVAGDLQTDFDGNYGEDWECVPDEELGDADNALDIGDFLHLDIQDEEEYFSANDTPGGGCTAPDSTAHTSCDGGSRDEDSDVDSSDEEEELETAPPLNLTNRDKVKTLLLLATKKRFNLTYPAAESVMELAGVLSRDDSPFIPSKYLLKLAIEKHSSSCKLLHLCPHCGTYIGAVDNQLTFECFKCDKEINFEQNKKDGNVFLYISLQDQIVKLLEICVTEDDLTKPSSREKIVKGNYEDIYDGTVYRKKVGQEECVTCNFFVDGVQVATTNKKSAWPILLVVNELPLHLRRKYVLLAGLWLGKGKPVMNEYLKPFVDECNHLATTGLTYTRNHEQKHVRVKIVMGVSDSIARPLLRSHIQFNGKFGCGLCYHPGFNMRRGKGKCRSYSIADRSYPLRTHEETMMYAEQAEREKSTPNGVVGKSVLSELIDFDIVRGLDLDLFHALVNTAKRFASLWFGQKYSKEPYSIRLKYEKVDERLLSITPTGDVSRAPRSLKERSDWRGHEWYFWVVLYSIPCLKNILPSRYFNHWGLLVSSLALVMQNSVAKSEVAYAGRYLKEFSEQIDLLYGKVHVTFSSHLLTHLDQSIKDYGQPWTHSAFIFESFNSEIKNSVKSSNGAAQQIVKQMQLREAIKSLEAEIAGCMTQEEKLYLKKTTCNAKQLPVPDRIVGGAHMLGPPKVGLVPLHISQALERSGVQCPPYQEVSIYNRMMMDFEIYHSAQYTRAEKTNNRVVNLENGNIFEIDCFVVLSNQCFALGNFFINSRKKLCDDLPHIRVCQGSVEGLLRSIPVQSIQQKVLCFTMEFSDSEIVRYVCINVLHSEMLS